jgi:hypothetical protein
MSIFGNDVVTAVLAQLKPGREYPYSRLKLNLGFKRASEQIPELFPGGISFGVPGSLLNSEDVHYALTTLFLEGVYETIESIGEDRIRFKPALRREVEAELLPEMAVIGISREMLAHAAAIVEDALRIPERELKELVGELYN